MSSLPLPKPNPPLQTFPNTPNQLSLNKPNISPKFLSIDNPSSSKIQPIAILANKFNLTKKIGKGGTSCVYLGHSHSDPSTQYAFKIIKSPQSQNLQNEYTILTSLSHNNIIKAYSYDENTSLYKPSKDTTSTVSYLQLDYIAYGELFDFIYYPKKGFGENFSKLITYKLCLALLHLYSNGFVHRDIKLENIMVDINYNIKLCDFGFGAQNDAKMNTHLGTAGYASPEVLGKQIYNGIANDIFSLGVTLFVLVTGSMPFRTVSTNDSFFRLILLNKFDEFWLKRGIKVSYEFQCLFNSMVTFHPEQRLSIEEVLCSAWICEGNYSKENYDLLKVELSKRREIVEMKKRKQE